jgi:hypothetical protein
MLPAVTDRFLYLAGRFLGLGNPFRVEELGVAADDRGVIVLAGRTRMRFPKLPARKDAPEHEEYDLQPEQATTPAGGPSAGYGDVAMPDLPPPPLTSELTRSIRFTISEPQGYYFEQVENFVQQVVDALHYYEQAEFAWRQAVYEMQVEMDQQAYDLQRVRSEIELFKVQGSPLVNADGSYVTESQQATNEAVLLDLSHTQAQLAEMQGVVAQRDEEVARLQGVAASQDQDIVSLRQWGEQMSADYHAMQEQLAALVAENDLLRAGVPVAPSDQSVVAEVPEAPALPVVEHAAPAVDLPTPAETYIEAPAEEAVEVPLPEVPMGALPVVDLSPADSPTETEADSEVEASYDEGDYPEEADYDEADYDETAETDAGAGEAYDDREVEDASTSETVADEYITTDDADDEEYGESVAVVPVDSELPEGAHLPGTGENAITYPPAAPGTPLDTQGVPVEVWAPELDARFQEENRSDAPADETVIDDADADADDAEDAEDALEPQSTGGVESVAVADEGEESVEVYSPADTYDPETYDSETYDPETDEEPDTLPAAPLESETEAETGSDVDAEGYEESDNYAHYDEVEDEEEEYGESVAVVPVDSELPEGAHLPGTGENAITYPPAAPGIPLDTQGVPVEVWAPELNPKLRAALEADKQEHDEEHDDADFTGNDAEQ